MRTIKCTDRIRYYKIEYKEKQAKGGYPLTADKQAGLLSNIIFYIFLKNFYFLVLEIFF